MKVILLCAVTACTAPQDAASVQPDAPGVTIDALGAFDRVALGFDDLADGAVVTTQYAAHATFSSDPGCELSTSSSAGVAASQPYYIWTYYSCATGDSASYFVDFARPVKHVAFTLVGVNSSSTCATVRLVHSDGSVETSNAIGKGDYAVPVVIDLAAAHDVKRLEIVNVDDAYGLGLDDVTFDFPR